MEIIYKNISVLKPSEYNPRKLNKKQKNDLMDSLNGFGIVEPAVVNTHPKRKNIIVGGHQRIKIAKEIGHKKFPCVEVNLSEQKEKELNIRLNKNTGEFDSDLLLEHFNAKDLVAYGFETKDLPSIMDLVVAADGEDDVPDVPDDPIVKLGEIYRLGNHRLMCGDSTNIEAVGSLMEGGKADMVFTDPPYNVDYGANQNHPSHKIRTIENDSMSDAEWDDFVSNYLQSIFLFCDGNMYITMSDKELGHLQLKFKEAGGKWGSFIIWVKNSLVLSAKDYHSRHETILYGWKEGVKGRLRVENRKSDDVWEIDRPTKSKEHPTMKPVELCERAIVNSSKRGMVVMDLFGGGGSTLIACEKTRRHCRMMELTPHYCDVIIKRWENFTGKKAKKCNATR